MSHLEIIQKLTAKIKSIEESAPSVIDDKYRLTGDDFDKSSYESDKSQYFQDIDCLRLAYSHFNEKLMIERALTLIKQEYRNVTI